MGDSAKAKTRSAARGSTNSSLAPGTRAFSPRPDLASQIAASAGPVTSEKEARSWLEKQGWILASEQYSKNKLADILFSVALAFKLPNEAVTALRSVAYLLRDLGKDDLASTISAKLIDKIANGLSKPIDKFSDSIAAANNFLLATSQQQASDLLSLQDSVKQQNDLTKSLAESSAKLSQNSAPPALSDSAWPLLTPTNPITPQPIHPSSLLHAHNAPPAAPKLLHRVALSSKQLLIEYGPLEENEAPRDKSIEAQRDLRLLFNKWIDNASTSPEGVAHPPSRAIRSVAIFERPAMLLEFESSDAKDNFAVICANNPSLLSVINPKARIRPCTYAIICRFVPCLGQFDPSIDDHLRNIERENDLSVGSITAASWCKRPDKRAPNQSTATLKVACSNPETANRLLTGRIRIEDHLVSVRKDLRIPTRCVKCQGYGHTQDVCTGIAKCSNCSSESHSSINCSSAPKCVSCGNGSSHPSSSPSCPAFMHKSDALVDRYPENAMPYFPTNESWTWAAAPSNPSPAPFPLPPPQLANPRQRHSPRPMRQNQRRHYNNNLPPHPSTLPPHPPSNPQSRQMDNGWPMDRQYQTTLMNAWGPQPPITLSATPHDVTPPLAPSP